MYRNLKPLLQKYQFLLIAFVAYFSTRLWIIEADLPVWSFANFTAMDEQYYTIPAFDWAFGNNFPGDEPNSLVFNLFQNFTTWISLAIFGNNYYGLRVPSLLCGFILLLISCKFLRDRFSLNASLIGGAILLSESTFFLANIVAEPTIFRMAAFYSFLYYLIYVYKRFNSGFIAGMLATCAFILVYPTNFFLIPALLIWLVFEHYESNRKTLAFVLAKCLLGMALIGVLYIVYFLFLANGKDTSKFVIELFGPSIDNRAGFLGIINGFESKAMNIFTAAYFENNFVFQVSILIALLLFIYGLPKISLTREDRTLFIFFAVYLLQLLFLNDYPKRKLVFILPLVIYFCNYVYYSVSDIPQNKSFQVICSALVILNLFIFSAVTYSNLLRERTFNYVRAMKSLGSHDGERMVGGFSYSFRLYNRTKPYLSWYRYNYTQKQFYEDTIKEHAKKEITQYSINYIDKKTRDEMSELGFIPERRLLKSNDPRYSHIYLYRYNGLGM